MGTWGYAVGVALFSLTLLSFSTFQCKILGICNIVLILMLIYTIIIRVVCEAKNIDSLPRASLAYR